MCSHSRCSGGFAFGCSAFWAGPAYCAAVLLLVGGSLLGMGRSANGATRWIGIGPVSSHSCPSWPSSGCCWSLPPFSARVDRRGSASRWRWCSPVVPIGLTLLQPDLSTTTLLAVLAGVDAGHRAGARAVPVAAGRGGGRLGAAGDRSAAAVPGRAARQFPCRCPRVPDRLGLGGAAGAHRGGLRDTVRPDRRPAPPPARAVLCPSGRPTWPWPAWSGNGDWSRAPVRYLPRSSSCGDSRWPAGRPVPRTGRWSGRPGDPDGRRARRLHRREPRPTASAGVRSPSSATAAPRSSCTLPRSGSSSPSAEDAPAEGCGPFRGGATPGRGSSGLTALGLSTCWSPSGSTGGGCRARRARLSCLPGRSR